MTHDDLVRVAVRWLKKPCSTRGPVGALNAAVAGYDGGERWYKPGCGVAVPELVSYNGEIPDAIGWIANGYSYAIECKASLADFRADKNKPRFRIEGHACVGAECLYLCPEGVIPPDDVPERWGLLYAVKRGRATVVRIVRRPKGSLRRDLQGEMSLMYSLLRRVEVHGNLTVCLSPKWGGVNPLVKAPESLEDANG